MKSGAHRHIIAYSVCFRRPIKRVQVHVPLSDVLNPVLMSAHNLPALKYILRTPDSLHDSELDDLFYVERYDSMALLGNRIRFWWTRLT